MIKIHWKRKKDREKVLAWAASDSIVKRRMAAIASANCFDDLRLCSVGRAHFLKGTLKNFFALDLEKTGNGKRLICEPVNAQKNGGGQYLKETIFEFEVIDIENYHRE